MLDLDAADSWGNSDSLGDHFARHGADFGAESEADYADWASRFFQDSQAENLPTKIDANGTIRVYDPETNSFGAFNPDGTTRTFFPAIKFDILASTTRCAANDLRG
jgi:pyocin large subunit-like protein